eukprot:XP_011672315.1 PREDICTED: uncharacterized protein LOC105442148 [Strongylocentrotus purpuratus]
MVLAAHLSSRRHPALPKLLMQKCGALRNVASCKPSVMPSKRFRCWMQTQLLEAKMKENRYLLFVWSPHMEIASAVKASGDCPKFVCPTVHDDIADDEIQLEAVQIPRPPIVDLQKYGISADITHWACERPLEEVRLEWNENSNGEGRVEIFYSNQWGTVCDTTWDMMAANVVCRQLGFWRAYASVDGVVFGSTAGPVWLDRTECSGDEDSLYRCRKDQVGQNRCKHETDAAVICDLTEYSPVTVDDISGFVFWGEQAPSRRVRKKAIIGSNQAVTLPPGITTRTVAIRKATRQLYVLGDRRITQSNLDYTNSVNVLEFSHIPTANCLTLDEPGGMMYYVHNPGVVKMAPIDGGNLQVVPLDISETPSSMLFASGWLVWVEPTNRRVGRIALRGSSQEIIYQELNDEVESPSGVAFIP